MNRSESIANLAAALAKAQAEFPAIPRSKNVRVTSKRTGQTYTFKYAPFEDILRATKDARAANGLAFVQSANGEAMETTIIHKSGEFISSSVPMMRGYQGLQEMGSELTYVSRYGFCKAFGIQADDDDDGNAADGNHVEEKKVSSISGAGVKQDAFDSLEADEKTWLRDLAHAMTQMVAKGDAAGALIEFDAAIPQEGDKRLPKADVYVPALQSLLDSKTRSALKAERTKQKEAA